MQILIQINTGHPFLKNWNYCHYTPFKTYAEQNTLKYTPASQKNSRKNVARDVCFFLAETWSDHEISRVTKYTYSDKI